MALQHRQAFKLALKSLLIFHLGVFLSFSSGLLLATIAFSNVIIVLHTALAMSSWWPRKFSLKWFNFLGVVAEHIVTNLKIKLLHFALIFELNLILAFFSQLSVFS